MSKGYQQIKKAWVFGGPLSGTFQKVDIQHRENMTILIEGHPYVVTALRSWWRSSPVMVYEPDRAKLTKEVNEWLSQQ